MKIKKIKEIERIEECPPWVRPRRAGSRTGAAPIPGHGPERAAEGPGEAASSA